MSSYALKNGSTELVYAEEMLIDQAGLDLLIDGEYVACASFEGLDPFRLAYDILPDDPQEFLPSGAVDDFNKSVEQIIKAWEAEGSPADAFDGMQSGIALMLTVLAQMKGYAK